MSFMLWELAKHKHVQVRLRNEVESFRVANDGSPLTAEDLEHMPYLQAVVKVQRDH
jgi:cytochrome P450